VSASASITQVAPTAARRSPRHDNLIGGNRPQHDIVTQPGF
jgi:hypothetical protein